MWSTRGRSMSTISRWALRLNKRLPTEAKWGKASRGTDGRVFPWGNEFPTNNRVTFRRKFNRLGFKALEKIDSMTDGRSPYGIHHMAGNVWEWVNDWFMFYAVAGLENSKIQKTSNEKILRGGSWYNSTYYVNLGMRFKLSPHIKLNSIGFRCVWDVQ